jgi:hypothetical protein
MGSIVTGKRSAIVGQEIVSHNHTWSTLLMPEEAAIEVALPAETELAQGLVPNLAIERYVLHPFIDIFYEYVSQEKPVVTVHTKNNRHGSMQDILH